MVHVTQITQLMRTGRRAKARKVHSEARKIAEQMRRVNGILYRVKEKITMNELPNEWWEPGAEDIPEIALKDQWVPDDMKLPFN